MDFWVNGFEGSKRGRALKARREEMTDERQGI
jgi:hypothetical protein